MAVFPELVSFMQFWHQGNGLRPFLSPLMGETIIQTFDFPLGLSILAETEATLFLIPLFPVPLFSFSTSEVGAEINASSCFAALMRFMGDQPGLKSKDEVDYVYEILQVCGSFCDGLAWVMVTRMG